jgi:mannose-1-phosphate guanylyltransferase
VLSEGQRLVAAVGLTGLCVIDAGDALLVVPRERAQDVRAVVDALKAAGRGEKL